MEAIWTKPTDIKDDSMAAKFDNFSNLSNKDIVSPSNYEIVLLVLVIALFFIPLIWHFSQCALLSY